MQMQGGPGDERSRERSQSLGVLLFVFRILACHRDCLERILCFSHLQACENAVGCKSWPGRRVEALEAPASHEPDIARKLSTAVRAQGERQNRADHVRTRTCHGRGRRLQRRTSGCRLFSLAVLPSPSEHESRQLESSDRPTARSRVTPQSQRKRSYDVATF